MNLAEWNQLNEQLKQEQTRRKDAERRLETEAKRTELLTERIACLEAAKLSLQRDLEQLTRTSTALDNEAKELHGTSATLLRDYQEVLKAARGLVNGLPQKARAVWFQKYPLLVQAIQESASQENGKESNNEGAVQNGGQTEVFTSF